MGYLGLISAFACIPGGVFVSVVCSLLFSYGPDIFNGIVDAYEFSPYAICGEISRAGGHGFNVCS